MGEPSEKTESVEARHSLGRVGARVVPIILLLLTWEGVSRFGSINPALFPPPSRVAVAFLDWWNSSELWRDVRASYGRMLLGFFGGGVTGVGIGMLTGRSRLADAILSPIVQILRPLPPVAIIPLVIVWFGIGDGAKVFSTAFAVFFPVWINTHLAASRISIEYLWSARLLCKSKARVVLTVLIPAALSPIIAGLRTGIAVAFVMVYVNELAGASSGIGYQISISLLAYRVDRMIAALAVLAAAGASADLLFALLVHVSFPWLQGRAR
jgi:NitT/TauT family transport system permease protein